MVVYACGEMSYQQLFCLCLLCYHSSLLGGGVHS